MEEKKYSQLKEMSIYLIGTVIVTGLNFVLSILYSYLFIPKEYGDYSLILSIYSLIASFSGGWITLSIVRMAGKFQNEGCYDKFRGSIFWSHSIISVIWILVASVIVINSEMPVLNKVILLLLSINYFFEYFNNILNYFFRFNGEVKRYNNSTILRGALKIAVILVSSYIIDVHSIIVLPIALLMSEMIIMIYWFGKTSIIKCLRENKLSIYVTKEVFKYGLPLIAVSAVSWILNVSDRYIIKIFYSSEEVGIYSYAYQIGSAVSNLIAQFIMLGAYPKIVKAWENDGRKRATEVIAEYLKKYIYLCIPLAVGVAFIGRLFFKEFIGTQYQEGSSVFIFTCFGILMMGLSQYPNKAWELTGRTAGILRLNVEAAVVNVILNFIFVPLMGYKWSAITTFFSFFIYFILAIYRSRKILPIHLNKRSFFNVIICSCIMGGYICIVNMIMKDSVAKLFVIIIGSIFVYSIGLILFKEINVKKLKRI